MADLAGIVASATRRFSRAALDLLLPPQCLCCDRQTDEPGMFCDVCEEAAVFVGEACCDACGIALRAGGRFHCEACRQAPPPWTRARAALRYDALSKRVVLPLKYGDRVDLAPALGAMMAQAGAALLREADMLVPVPLHRARLRARRYNQAALLALAVGRRAGVAVTVDALTRTRATAPLGELSAEARLHTVAGAFAVRERRLPAIVGRRIVLIDDVLTSGATAAGCAEALLDAGAHGVDVLVAARVGRAWTGSHADVEPAGAAPI